MGTPDSVIVVSTVIVLVLMSMFFGSRVLLKLDKTKGE